MINTDMIVEELSQIIKNIQNGEFELDELTVIFQKISNDEQHIFSLVDELSGEQEDRYIKALGKKIEEIIREIEVNEINEQINLVQSRELTIIERFFGKDKLQKAMVLK